MLVRLDDAVDELELEVGLSGALYGGSAPSSLRRARITAAHVRDDSFEDYRSVSRTPPCCRPTSARAPSRSCAAPNEALAIITRARAEHAEWMRANVSAADQIAAAQGTPERASRLDGRPGEARRRAFVAFRGRRMARGIACGLAPPSARSRMRAATSRQPRRSRATRPAAPWTTCAAAERSLRRAEEDARILEESHRLVTQAAQAVPGEFETARTALRQAMVDAREPAARRGRPARRRTAQGRGAAHGARDRCRPASHPHDRRHRAGARPARSRARRRAHRPAAAARRAHRAAGHTRGRTQRHRTRRCRARRTRAPAPTRGRGSSRHSASSRARVRRRTRSSALDAARRAIRDAEDAQGPRRPRRADADAESDDAVLAIVSA